MKRKALSKTDLHRQSGVSQTTIRSLTSGAIVERIDRNSTAKLLETLDCDFENLWTIEWIEIEENKISY